MNSKWIELYLPKTEKYLYTDIANGNCSWEKPENVTIKQKGQQEWWELNDNKSNKPYYYNTKTKIIEWNRPIDENNILSLTTIKNTSIINEITNGINSLNKKTCSKSENYINKVENSSQQKLKSQSNSSQHSLKISNPILNEGSIPQVNLNNTPGGHTQILPVSMKFDQYKRISSEFINHIKNYKIDEFAKNNFMEHRFGLFRRKIPIRKLICWSKKSISKPLLKSSSECCKDAVNCFALVQRIFGDKQPQGGINEIQKLVEIGILNEKMRDEIYCQVCKQLTNNPNSKNVVLGWKLMSVLVIAFPPSRKFEEYLKCFIESFTLSTDEDIKILSKHCYRKLAKTCIVGPRGKTLALKEIEQNMNAAYNFSVFGETLEEIMENQIKEKHSNLEIPEILKFLTDSIIKLNGSHTEGIFRVPGDVDQVTELRCKLEKGNYDISECSDPNVPASLLKLWLRELAEPLIPSNVYEKCIEIGRDENENDIGQKAWDLINSLPKINKLVIMYMTDFLKIIAKPENQEYTKMTLANLAMVFAPNFLRCPSDNPETIFQNTKYEQAFIRVLILK